MIERKLAFDKIVYGDICQRSNHISISDEDIENFEEEILAALEEDEE